MEKYFNDKNLNYYYYYFTDKGNYIVFEFKNGSFLEFQIDSIKE